MKIDKVLMSEYADVVNVWEASVRATHHFLSEEDIRFFKPRILHEYLACVNLRCIRNPEDKIEGFIGVNREIIEMLFVRPEAFGKGIGKKLLQFAITEMKATELYVNEENPPAIGFYQHFGFKIVARSETDPSGKPYPVLHMAL